MAKKSVKKKRPVKKKAKAKAKGPVKKRTMPKGGKKSLWTAMQKAYVKHYLVSLNQADAARKAGFKKPAEAGCRLMKMAHVKALIDKCEVDRAERLNIKADEVLQGLKCVGNGNVADFYTFDSGSPVLDMSKATRDQLSAVSSIKTKLYKENGKEVEEVTLKLHPTTPARKLLGDHLKLWNSDDKFGAGERVTVINVITGISGAPGSRATGGSDE